MANLGSIEVTQGRMGDHYRPGVPVRNGLSIGGSKPRLAARKGVLGLGLGTSRIRTETRKEKPLPLPRWAGDIRHKGRSGNASNLAAG